MSDSKEKRKDKGKTEKTESSAKDVVRALRRQSSKNAPKIITPADEHEAYLSKDLAVSIKAFEEELKDLTLTEPGLDRAFRGAPLVEKSPSRPRALEALKTELPPLPPPVDPPGLTAPNVEELLNKLLSPAEIAKGAKRSAAGPEGEPGPEKSLTSWAGASQLSVSGCRNPTVSAFIKGTFILVGENHGKPLFKKNAQENRFDVMIFFWDARDGEAFNGWWFGPKVGGDEVYAFNSDTTSMLPPEGNWRVPHYAKVDPTLQLFYRSRSGLRSKSGSFGNLPALPDALVPPEARTIEVRFARPISDPIHIYTKDSMCQTILGQKGDKLIFRTFNHSWKPMAFVCVMWLAGMFFGMMAVFGVAPRSMIYVSLLMLPLPVVVFLMLAQALIKELAKSFETWYIVGLSTLKSLMDAILFHDIRMLFVICYLPTAAVVALLDAYPAKNRFTVSNALFICHSFALLLWTFAVLSDLGGTLDFKEHQMRINDLPLGPPIAFENMSTMLAFHMLVFAVKNLGSINFRDKDFLVIVKSRVSSRREKIVIPTKLYKLEPAEIQRKNRTIPLGFDGHWNNTSEMQKLSSASNLSIGQGGQRRSKADGTGGTGAMKDKLDEKKRNSIEAFQNNWMAAMKVFG